MLISSSPIRIYLFSDKLLLIFRSQPRKSSSKKPWSPRRGHCGGLGNKNGPISNSTLVPHGYHNKQTRKQTNHQINKRTRSFPLREETLVWQSKEEVLGGKGVRRGGGRRGCVYLPSWKLVYPRTCLDALGGWERVFQRCPRQLWKCLSHWLLHPLRRFSKWSSLINLTLDLDISSLEFLWARGFGIKDRWLHLSFDLACAPPCTAPP